ncbi:MAG TPA: MAPEG family protein [Parvularculaceae bacterium]|nr:MAPEG family protein [Parvularculaceae bacterium]
MLPTQAAALWIGLNILFLIFISARVGAARTKTKTNLGDGGGNEIMVKAIRTQGNYIEYAPAALLGLYALAQLGLAAVWIHLLGAVFLFARISHLLGLGMDVWPKGRFVGTLFTMLTLLATALLLIWKALS